MGVLDDFSVDPKISMPDKVKIKAQVLVPVMQALREKLGRDEADAMVKGALRDWSKAIFAGIAEDAGGSEVTFNRAQTPMQGAPSCTFRYKFAPR